jgi:hypothetical protein
MLEYRGGNVVQTLRWIERVFEELQRSASHGLNKTIRRYRKVEDRIIESGVCVEYDISIGDTHISLRIQNPLSHMRRRKLRELLTDASKPLVLLHHNATYQTIKNRIAKGLKLALDRMKRTVDVQKHRFRTGRHHHRSAQFGCN